MVAVVIAITAMMPEMSATSWMPPSASAAWPMLAMAGAAFAVETVEDEAPPYCQSKRKEQFLHFGLLSITRRRLLMIFSDRVRLD